MIRIFHLIKFFFTLVFSKRAKLNIFQEVSMFSTLSLVNACLVQNANVFNEVENASTVLRKIELIFEVLPIEFKALLDRQHVESISQFNELVHLVDADLNPRSVDRYRRAVVAQYRLEKLGFNKTV